MPTHSAIVDNLIPQQVEKPIPSRTVSTRTQRVESKIAGQPIIDSSPAADSATPEESVRLSPQLSALARKEQAFRQREQALKDREKEIESRLASADKYEQLKAKLSEKDFSEAEQLGLSYEDYTAYKLKGEDEDPQEVAIKALEAKITALEKSKEEDAVNQFQETVGEYRKEIAKLVETPEFKAIKALGREDVVLQVILDAFEEDNEELSVEEAARDVLLFSKEEAKKWESLIERTEPEQEVEQKRMLPRPVVGKTLTNDMTSVTEKRPYKSLQHLSEAERYAEARRRVLERRFKGENK